MSILLNEISGKICSICLKEKKRNTLCYQQAPCIHPPVCQNKLEGGDAWQPGGIRGWVKDFEPYIRLVCNNFFGNVEIFERVRMLVNIIFHWDVE